MRLRLLSLILLLTFFTYFLAVHRSQKQVEYFLAFEEENRKLRTTDALEKEPALQKREKVRKDLYFNEDHLIIESERSELKIEQKKGKAKLFEELEDVTCDLNGEFFLKSKRGSYRYPSHEITFEQDCVLLHEKGSLQASKIYFSPKDNSLICENPNGLFFEHALNFQAKQLVWNPKKENIQCTGYVMIHDPEQFTIFSDRGTIFLNKLHPTKVVLNQNVRINLSEHQKKQTFALADQLIYDTQEKKVNILGKKKVLFWQEGLSMSAQELVLTKEKAVFAKGDVHFSLSLDDEKKLEEIFQK